ncbi:hypothetical protein [Sorangium sp. So ce117]|uniref:hypothetical protein n=1 Tax=Sorangium sp. So ce117 TaxID=3133277 RepID=UPI003F5FB9CC
MAEYSGQDRFPGSFETLNDGTVRDAASVNVGLEALADRTAYLFNRRIEAVHFTSWGNEDGGVGLPPATTYADWLDAGSRVFRVDVPNVEPLDVLLLDCSFTLEFLASGTGDQARVRLVAVAPNGSTLLPVGAHVASELRNLRAPMAISGVLVAPQTGTYRVKLQGKTRNGDPGQLAVYDAFVLRVLHLKR